MNIIKLIMFRKTIGILGGMGPVASADTYVELTKMCQQKYMCVQDVDFPAVILYSLPLTGFDHRGFSENGEERKKIVNQLKNGLTKLEQAGADIIIIDCNTVHYFFDELQASITTPIINLIELTVHQVKSDGYTRVAIISSEVSRNVGLYTKPFEEAGIAVINTSLEEQESVNEAILAVMGGSVTINHIGGINSLIDSFMSRGAQCVILGCTEISNIARQLSHKAVLVDSEALAIVRAMNDAR
ncbi:amino acid racemase [bacterium]|nr:amino acid racemase [bacterium]